MHTDEELVAGLLEVLEHLGEEGGWDGDTGVVLRADEEKVDVMPLAGRHPREVLLGLRADPEWRAMALLSWGWAARMGEGRPSTHPERLRSRTAIAVARSGAIAARSHLADGRVLEDIPEGNLIDCLLRALDRPTAPPAVGTQELFARHWLGYLAAEVRRRRGLSWPEAAKLHPAMQLAAWGELRVGPDDLVTIAAALARVCGWSEVRRRCIEEAWLEDQVRPSIASWMDEGMLSRWLLEGSASVDDLLKHLNGLLVPAVARRVRRTLRQLGVEVAGGEAAGGRSAPDGHDSGGGEDTSLPVDGHDSVGDCAGLV